MGVGGLRAAHGVGGVLVVASLYLGEGAIEAGGHALVVGEEMVGGVIDVLAGVHHHLVADGERAEGPVALLAAEGRAVLLAGVVAGDGSHRAPLMTTVAPLVFAPPPMPAPQPMPLAMTVPPVTVTVPPWVLRPK